MDAFLIKALQLVASLAMLVVIHEFGHYIFARLFGIKVEKFYLFFNPWFSIVKWKPKSKVSAPEDARPTWRDTEYGIGWLPLGGYCKIAGMIDESMDKKQMALPPKPWEFRSKPAWQRLLVMVGGVTFNFILAIVIYAGIAFWWGERYIEYDKAAAGMEFTEPAHEVGFRDGDVLLMADGRRIDASRSNHQMEIVTSKTVTVLRNGRDTVQVHLPSDFALRVADAPFMTFRMPVYVDKVVGNSPARKAGLQSGDHILAVGGMPTPSYAVFTKQLLAHAAVPTTITFERNGRTMVDSITPDSDGKIGFQLKSILDVYPVQVHHFGFFESFPQGWQHGTDTLGSYVGSLKFLFTKQGAKSVGGFGAIGNMFPERWNWLSFWEITAFLSVILAFMNIIPIPALDGGHVMFLLYEVVTRRKPSDRVLEIAQYAGMMLLITLLVYANGADIVRAFL